jgi:hypothetical protein
MEHRHTSTGETTGASGVMNRVRQTATAQLSTQKDRATDGLGSLAQAVRKTSQPLRESNQDTIAGYVEQAADQIDRFSTRLRERDVQELVQDAQQLARRQPALFIGGAFALGLLTARFLKSAPTGNGRSHWDQGTSAGDWRQPSSGATSWSQGGAGGL